MRFVIAVLLLGWGGLPLAVAQPLHLAYGVNTLDINADGVKDVIVRARWENFNAHSFDKYMIMMSLPQYESHFYEVPKGDSYDYTFRTNEGADCLRAGYTFELDRRGWLQVTRYGLDAGKETYCEASRLTTTVYQLTDSVQENGFGLPGQPYFYLKQVKETRGKKMSSVSEFID